MEAEKKGKMKGIEGDEGWEANDRRGNTEGEWIKIRNGERRGEA